MEVALIRWMAVRVEHQLESFESALEIIDLSLPEESVFFFVFFFFAVYKPSFLMVHFLGCVYCHHGPFRAPDIFSELDLLMESD